MSFEGIMQSSSTNTTDGTQAGTPTPSALENAQQTKTAEQDKDPFADNFVRLARRERQLREREGKLSTFEKQLAEYQERERLAKEDPLAFIDRYGIDLGDVTRRLVEDPISPEKKELLELKNKMKKWEQEKEEQSKRQKEQETTTAFQQAQKELQDLLDKDADKYELIRMQNANDLVFQVIVEFQNQHGRWLSFEEAAEKVESHLESQVSKLLESKKIKSRLAPQTENQAEDSMAAKPESMNGSSSPTLSNFNANHSTPRPDGRVSDEELMKRALAVMKNG